MTDRTEATRVGQREGRSGRLELLKLTKQYPSLVAVDAMDLEVRSGEFMTLLGPSGSGKTTTLMMIAGFTPPTDGDIMIDGVSISAMAPERRDIGVVFQNYALFPHMTLFGNVAFPLEMRGMNKSQIRGKVHDALELVHLAGLDERLPRQLSGGQQQRVALARALVFNPRLLLMDEPLGALDKNLREQMQFELKRLHRELGVTIVYVTHDQEEALTMSDRVALMNQGRIEQLGTAQALYEQPANRFVAEFVGESNLIDGALSGDGGTGASWFVDETGTRFRVATPADDGLRNGPVSLVLRPEKLAVVPASEGTAEGLEGTVEETLYVGDFTRYSVRIRQGLALAAKASNNKRVVKAENGEEVRVSWDPEDAYVIPR
jgi:spermidine/putrescine ABC transporter ATP-binding subunit